MAIPYVLLHDFSNIARIGVVPFRVINSCHHPAPIALQEHACGHDTLDVVDSSSHHNAPQ